MPAIIRGLPANGADPVHPQGGPGYTLYAAYSGVVLVAGGSGISYIMGVLDDMLQKHASGKSRVCVIEVIWAIQDAGKGSSQKKKSFRTLARAKS